MPWRRPIRGDLQFALSVRLPPLPVANLPQWPLAGPLLGHKFSIPTRASSLLCAAAGVVAESLHALYLIALLLVQLGNSSTFPSVLSHLFRIVRSCIENFHIVLTSVDRKGA